MRTAATPCRRGRFLRRRDAYRSCGSDSTERFLSLGPTPLANSFLDGPEEIEGERWYPLDVHFCQECSLVQLLDVVDPEVLFSDYLYVSGTSETIARHNREPAGHLIDLADLTGDDLVVEVGSNEGSLLRCFQELDVGTLGVEPAANLAERARLRIARLERIPVHGGSLRLFFRPGESGEHAPAVMEAVREERRAGLHDLARYREFADDVRENRQALREPLSGLRDEGHRIAAYGAAAKGNTLLNYCGLGPDLIEFVADRNPLKVDTLTPGTHIPVRPAEALEREQPDFVLLLAWNFAEEIRAQQRDYREAGGRFVVPVPSPNILDRP